MAEGENMKANIHPEVKDATVTCACGATFQTKSTKEKIDVAYKELMSMYDKYTVIHSIQVLKEKLKRLEILKNSIKNLV